MKDDVAPPLGLFDRLSSPQPSPADLREAAQLAVQVEFTTIPPYLTALYSIQDPGSVAYQTLRSVAMEEMYHVNQAANILVGLGGVPRFTGDYTPVYPGHLPQANPLTTPQVGLFRASTDVFEDVFCAIETPAAPGAPPQGNNYDTIAQLYEALKAAVDAYPGNPFEASRQPGRQRTNIYIGKFGGKVIDVRDKKQFHLAVTEIVKQGEGTVPVDKSYVPVEPFGAYNHYGKRTDGTYGPILGTPEEMSHFAKFRHVALDTANFPATLPITSNPRVEDFSNPMARAQAVLFNQHYSVMLRALERTFTADVPDPYFGVVLNLMHKVLPNLARALMNTAAHKGGNASVGPNATPTWEYDPEARLSRLAGEIQSAMDGIHKSIANSAAREAAMAPLSRALQGVEMISADAATLDL